MAVLLPTGKQAFEDGTGAPLVGGKLYTYAAGTSTPLATYADAGGGAANANPTILDARGEATIFWAGYYKVTLKDSLDNLIWTVDNVSAADIAATTYATRAGAVAATIGASVTSLQTSGYATPGDRGGATYTRVASNPNIGVGGFQSADGAWWQYAINGLVYIEQFGGKSDCPWAVFSYASGAYASTYAPPGVGTVTDNLQPLYDATRAVNTFTVPSGVGDAGSLIAVWFLGNPDQTKCYWFSDTIVPQFACCIEGTFSGGDTPGVGTKFRFPPNKGGITFNHRLTQPVGYQVIGTSGSVARGIWWQGGGGTDRTKHGLWQRVPILVENCVFDSFPGNNTNNVGFTGFAASDVRFGLTSGTRYDNVTCRAAGNWNSWVDGSDVSASTFINLHHKDSRLGGLSDTGYYVNHYIGYQNNAHAGGHAGTCAYGGRHYVLIDRTPGIGATTTPGTNDRIWEDREAGTANTSWPAWSGSATYELSLPTFISSGDGVMTGYTENYYLPDLGGKRLGGTPFLSRYADGSTYDQGDGSVILYSRHFAWRYTPPPGAFAYLGTVQTRIGGASYEPYMAVTMYPDLLNNEKWSYAFEANWLRFGGGGPGDGTPSAHLYLRKNTATTLGRATPMPYYGVATSFALGNPNGLGDARAMEMGAGAPSGTGRAKGEVIFRNDSSIGGTAGYYAMGDGTVQPLGIVGAVQSAAQANSAAGTVAALVTDFNALLARLRAAGLMAP